MFGHSTPSDSPDLSPEEQSYIPTKAYKSRGSASPQVNLSEKDNKADYLDDEHEGEKVYIQLSKLDQFAGKKKSYGNLANIDRTDVESLFDKNEVREAFTSRQLAMISLAGVFSPFGVLSRLSLITQTHFCFVTLQAQWGQVSFLV